ncbi:MAG: hypothetical protein GXP42_18480 [Chloroflexi bacterium]|nr:hypothetical protein [Chloroflexota bacterium]
MPPSDISPASSGKDALAANIRATRPPTVVLSPENREHLRRFPRPPRDNGIGLHFHLDLRDEFIKQTVERLQSINATWTLIYAQDAQQARRAAKACWDVGVMPVLRPGKLIDEPFDPVPYVKALQEIGAPPYVQVHNEPEDVREWRAGRPPPGWDRIFGQSWASLAVKVFDAGGYPGIQVLDRPGFDAAVDAIKAMGREDVWQRAVFIHHNYGANHPPDYPYDERNQKDNPGQTILEDYNATLRFLAHAAWMQERLGFVLPIIGGEGGWLFGSENDRRYPKVDEELHALYHAEMFNWLRTGVLANGEPLPDYLFSITAWIVSSWTFGGQNWWDNPLSPQGKLTATIEAVAAIPRFERRFSWDEPDASPAEPEEDSPPPPDEPDAERPSQTPPLAWDPRLDELGVRLERTNKRPAWRLISAQYQDPTESGGRHHVDFIALDADGRPAAGVRFLRDWKGRLPNQEPAYAVTDEQGKANIPLWVNFNPDKKDGLEFATAADEPGDTVFGMGLPMNRHVNFVLTYQWVDAPSQPPPPDPKEAEEPPMKTLSERLLAEADKRQVIQFNPDAALQKRIFADGFVPNSAEFTLEIEGKLYLAQRAEHLATGEVRVYYVREGDWGRVEFIRRD